VSENGHGGWESVNGHGETFSVDICMDSMRDIHGRNLFEGTEGYLLLVCSILIISSL